MMFNDFFVDWIFEKFSKEIAKLWNELIRRIYCRDCDCDEHWLLIISRRAKSRRKALLFYEKHIFIRWVSHKSDDDGDDDSVDISTHENSTWFQLKNMSNHHCKVSTTITTTTNVRNAMDDENIGWIEFLLFL